MVQIFCAYTGLINFLTCLGLAIFLYFKHRAGHINKIFALWSASVAFWSLGYFMWLWTPDRESALFWARFLMAGAIVIPSSFLHFTLVYLGLDRQHRWLIIAAYLFSAFYLILDFTPYFILTVESRYWFRWWPVPGFLYHLYQAFFILTVIYTHILLFKRALTAPSAMTRKQFKIVAYGTLIAFTGGSTNFFLWYNIPIPPIFNFLVTGYVAFIAYAILNYKLWDIEVIIKKTIVFAGIVTTAVSIIAIPIALAQALIGKALLGVLNPFVLLTIGVATAVLIYRPVEKFLVNLTDEYLFQKKFDYQKLLKDASAGISRIKSLHHLLQLVVHFITMRVRVKNAAVLVYDEKEHVFQFCYPRGYAKDDRLRHGIMIHEYDPMIRYMAEGRTSLEIEKVREMAQRPNKANGNGPQKPDFRVIGERMKELCASCCVPSFLGDRLRGVLVLGEKKSEESYTETDLNVLYTLAQESAIAIENARLYDEAVNRSLELQRINEELKTTHAALLEEKKRAVLAGIGESVAHEIRNPISPINGHLYFIRKRLDEMKVIYEENPAERSEKDMEKFLKNYAIIMDRVGMIGEAKDRIQGIVNTLFHLVAEKTENKVEVKLDMVAASAIEEVKYQKYWETLCQPTIKNDIPRRLPFASGIPQDIQGVFVNLIINSLYALQKTVDKKINIDGMVDPDNPEMVKIEYSDNGCGMTEEVLKRCFDHQFTTKGAQGTGLGLFYCKHIIEGVHGGKISVKSQPGVGTWFTIVLPCFKKETEGKSE